VKVVNTGQMIIDERMPRYDVVIAEHLVVDADPHATLAAGRDLDFVSVHPRCWMPRCGRVGCRPGCVGGRCRR